MPNFFLFFQSETDFGSKAERYCQQDHILLMENGSIFNDSQRMGFPFLAIYTICTAII